MSNRFLNSIPSPLSFLSEKLRFSLYKSANFLSRFLHPFNSSTASLTFFKSLTRLLISKTLNLLAMDILLSEEEDYDRPVTEDERVYLVLYRYFGERICLFGMVCIIVRFQVCFFVFWIGDWWYVTCNHLVTWLCMNCRWWKETRESSFRSSSSDYDETGGVFYTGSSSSCFEPINAARNEEIVLNLRRGKDYRKLDNGEEGVEYALITEAMWLQALKRWVR